MSLTRELLVNSIIRFLRDTIAKSNDSSEITLSLDVALQCLEQAFQPRAFDPATCPQQGLEEIFTRGLEALEFNVDQCVPEVSQEDKIKAEELKNRGNDLLKSDLVNEGLECYNKAIKLDPKNAVYYCNRAAAHSRLGNHNEAIKDCKKAVQIDGTYSKAYGRLGVAYTSLSNYAEATKAYKKALELDPDNESYKNNLSMVEEKFLASRSSEGPNDASQTLPNIGTLFSNPQLVSMATQMLNDPDIQNLISGIMGAYGNNDLSSVLQAGQQLGQQINQQNPNFAAGLRQNIGNATNPEQPAAPTVPTPNNGDAPPKIEKEDDDNAS